jgi:hypothetical protein
LSACSRMCRRSPISRRRGRETAAIGLDQTASHALDLCARHAQRRGTDRRRDSRFG